MPRCAYCGERKSAGLDAHLRPICDYCKALPETEEAWADHVAGFGADLELLRSSLVAN